MEDQTTPNLYRELAKDQKNENVTGTVGIETQKSEHDADDRRPKTIRKQDPQEEGPSTSKKNRERE